MTSIEEFLQEHGRDYFVAADELPIETLQELTARYREWQRETSRPLSGTLLTAAVANDVVQWKRGQESHLHASDTVKTVVVEPGDVVVFNTDRDLNHYEYEKVLKIMHETFPNNRVAICMNGDHMVSFKLPEEQE